jgi:hypothetical protein
VTLVGDQAVIDGLAGAERGIDAGVRIEASGVEFRGNNVTGNGLANLPPSCRFDMIS